MTTIMIAVNRIEIPTDKVSSSFLARQAAAAAGPGVAAGTLGLCGIRRVIRCRSGTVIGAPVPLVVRWGGGGARFVIELPDAGAA